MNLSTKLSETMESYKKIRRLLIISNNIFLLLLLLLHGFCNGYFFTMPNFSTNGIELLSMKTRHQREILKKGVEMVVRESRPDSSTNIDEVVNMKVRPQEE